MLNKMAARNLETCWKTLRVAPRHSAKALLLPLGFERQVNARYGIAKRPMATDSNRSESLAVDEVHEEGTPPHNIARIKPKQFDISFEDYLKLKNSVRTRQRVAGMPFAFVGLGTSSVVSAYMFPEMFDATPENVQLIMGLDPLVFCGICGVVSAGIGYSIGTQLFKGFWKLMNKDKAIKLLEREKDFLERIQKHRFASFSKFEDDYYGESIKNLSDYRQWLRTQQKKADRDKKFSGEKESEANEQARTA
eukprot:Seg985.1 transcript_id=Seg985.1/GoldUCD/mRNA.D3Y31 product="Presequence translocated-associated motor subunit pam17 mitochondrial" protein_id=Seg985.1/GoldUCD/D3Y31